VYGRRETDEQTDWVQRLMRGSYGRPHNSMIAEKVLPEHRNNGVCLTQSSTCKSDEYAAFCTRGLLNSRLCKLSALNLQQYSRPMSDQTRQGSVVPSLDWTASMSNVSHSRRQLQDDQSQRRSHPPGWKGGHEGKRTPNGSE